MVEAALAAKLTIPEATGIKEESGLGVIGAVEGATLLVGRASWLEEKSIAVAQTEEASPHLSAISVALNGVHAGTLYFEDTLRPETARLKARLEAEGIDRFVMLTGDRASAARHVAAQSGFAEFQAECLPAQKREAVEALKRDGYHVLVVGDGVNDAPALAAGHLSMAMGALGSDVAIQTADIALMSSDLDRVPQFLRLAGQTLRIVNQNMLCGLAFIGLTLVLSGAGYISPIAAAFVHELGAFFVIFNSARLLKFEGHRSG